MYSTIISTKDLKMHLSDPKWLIVDCSFTTAQPNDGYLNYLDVHIPGAKYAHLNNNLASHPTPTTGRHPLPDPVKFNFLLSTWGLTPETQVACYDMDGGASASARLWWLLRSFGHNKVAVLDGGLPAWFSADYPVESGEGILEEPKCLLNLSIDPLTYVDSYQVEQILKQEDWLIMDARSKLRYSGMEELIDRTGGRIPGAVSLPYSVLLDQSLHLLPDDDLEKLFSNTLKGIPTDHVIVYCGSSVISNMIVLAMEKIGLHGAKLYVGSWSEWITDPNHPIATR